MGRPTKYLRLGEPGVTRLWIGLDVETRQTRRPTGKKQERNKRPGALQLIERGRAYRPSHKLHAPRICEDRRGDAEADDVGQRIEFPSEIAGGIGHAGDASVEAVEHHGEANRLRRHLEALGRQRGIRWKRSYGGDGADDGKIPEKNVPRGKQSRQCVGSARGPFAGYCSRR